MSQPAEYTNPDWGQETHQRGLMTVSSSLRDKSNLLCLAARETSTDVFGSSQGQLVLKAAWGLWCDNEFLFLSLREEEQRIFSLSHPAALIVVYFDPFEVSNLTLRDVSYSIQTVNAIFVLWYLNRKCQCPKLLVWHVNDSIKVFPHTPTLRRLPYEWSMPGGKQCNKSQKENGKNI